MTNKPQPYCQLETMTNLLSLIKGSKPVALGDIHDPSYHGVGIKVKGMDYMTILFERNGLSGVTYDVEGYTGSRTWRLSKTPELNDDFVQRTEVEFCAAVVKEVNEIRVDGECRIYNNKK